MPSTEQLSAPIQAFKDRALPWLTRPRPVRTLLLLMSLALLLPVLAFAASLVGDSARRQRTQIDERLVQVATDLADTVDREFERILTLLDTIALSQRLAQRDFAAFHAEASVAVRRLRAHILLVDPTGQQLINTRVRFGTALSKMADAQSLRTAVATGAPVVSNLLFGPVAQDYIFDVLIPLSGDGLREHVLILSLNAAHFLEIMAGQNLPATWLTGISDRSGAIVARSRDHKAFVGKTVPAELVDAKLTGRAAFTTVGMDGQSTRRAIAQSKRAGWLFSAIVPTAIVDAEIRRSQMTLALGGASLLVLALALASLLARWIIVPIQALSASAVTLDADAIPPQLVSPVVEVNEVAAALRTASIALKSRTAHLRESERRLDVAQRTARLAYLDLDLQKGAISVSETFEDIFGFLPPAAGLSQVNEAFLARVHPDDRARVALTQARASNKVGTFEMEFRVVQPDGQIRWIFTQGETIGDAAGRPIQVFGSNLDITRLKEQEEHIRFLMREVTHRSKNLLAIIQALATQTAKTSPNNAIFQERFSQRLQGMAASHDLLVNQDWRGVELGALVCAQLDPFVGAAGGRFDLAGPGIVLKPQAAQSIGMALHELATNATKYGALSVPDGRVRIVWSLSGAADNVRFLMTWSEMNGPAVAAPDRKGFGHTVFDRMIAQSLNGSVKLTFAATGLVWELDAALESVRGQHHATASETQGRPTAQPARGK